MGQKRKTSTRFILCYSRFIFTFKTFCLQFNYSFTYSGRKGFPIFSRRPKDFVLSRLQGVGFIYSQCRACNWMRLQQFFLRAHVEKCCWHIFKLPSGVQWLNLISSSVPTFVFLQAGNCIVFSYWSYGLRCVQ